jgi:integrase
MRFDLNDAMLRALRPPAKGRIELLDADVPGLALRLTAAGVATWTVRARLPDGKRVRPSFGQWPTVGISAARKRARVLIGQIAAGTDPTSEKRKARETRAARAGLPTVAARLTEWQDAREAEWSERYRAEVKRLAAKLIEPRLGKRVLTETMRDDWTGLIAAVRKKTPATAAWLYSTVSSFLTYAEVHGWAPINVLPRRAKNLIAPSVAARERVLTDDELIHVWQAGERLTPRTRAFVRLLIMTAARLDEVANIAVSELDCEAARWRLPPERAKNKTALTLPLHRLLVAELQAVWPDGKVGADYRLLGAIDGSGFQSPSKLKIRIDKLSGVTDWRWHDLRRTARSGMSRLGVDARAAEAALNHISDRTKLQRTYDRYDYAAEAIKALETWQAHVAGLVTEVEARQPARTRPWTQPER